MILSALATLLLAAAAMAPGLILCRGAQADLARLAAAATASLAVSLMVTALTGILFNSIAVASFPAWGLLPISLALSAMAAWRTRDTGWKLPKVEWHGILVAAAFALYGAITYQISVTDLSDGSLRLHAWYNADWFKHLGHTFALADYGIPARDIFGNGRPLHYYWLFYILPGGAAAFGGDGWTALFVSNIIAAFLVMLTFYGVLRASGMAAYFAVISVSLAIVCCAPIEGWGPLLRGEGIASVLGSANAPGGPSFIGFAHYIPQHALAFALLLGRITVMLDRGKDTNHERNLHWLSLAGLSTIMTISTLFGAVLLCLYGLFSLCQRKFRVLPELIAMAFLASFFVLLLGVVRIDHPGSAMESPLMANWGGEGSILFRSFASCLFVIQNGGLAFIICVYLFTKWNPSSRPERDAKILALITLLLSLGIALVLEVAFEGRLAREIRIRLFNLPHLFVALTGGWMAWKAWQKGAKQRREMVLVTLLIALIALPALVLRTAWHGGMHDNFNTIIPADDRKVLTRLRGESRPRDVVWQYPEKPFLSNFAGNDSWSVVLAGRTNVASERATDYAAAFPDIQLAYRYFAGEDVPIPGSVDWIYLSRKLHPESYSVLVARLVTDPKWTKRTCYPDACLFARADSLTVVP